MELNHVYTVEEVLEIVNTFKPEEKIRVRDGIQESLVNKEEIELIMDKYHKKYEATYKALA